MDTLAGLSRPSRQDSKKIIFFNLNPSKNQKASLTRAKTCFSPAPSLTDNLMFAHHYPWSSKKIKRGFYENILSKGLTTDADSYQVYIRNTTRLKKLISFESCFNPGGKR